MEKIIIKTKDWVPGDGILTPARVVLLKWQDNNGKITQYSTHLQCKEKEKLYLIYGHYFFNETEALADFDRRTP